MFDAVLFDLDETLILDEPVSRHAFITVGLELTGDADKALQLGEAAHRHTVALWKTMAPIAIEYGKRIGHSAVEGLWAKYDRTIPAEAQLERELDHIRPEVWRLALAECGLTGDPAKLEQRWRAVRSKYPLYDDTDEMLARLRPHVKLGIITNGVSGLQRMKLNGCGLLHWFDVAAVSGEVGIGKPEAGIFEWVTKQLGVKHERCLMVGDNDARDVLGGKNAGIKTVWIDRKGLGKAPTQAADWTVMQLREVLPLVLPGMVGRS